MAAEFQLKGLVNFDESNGLQTREKTPSPPEQVVQGKKIIQEEKIQLKTEDTLDVYEPNLF